MVAHEAWLTQDNLRTRGSNMCSRYYLCESFWQCESVVLLWTMFVAIFGVQGFMPENFRGLLGCWKSIYVGKCKKKIWITIPVCIAWTIWRERNRRCFNGLKEHFKFWNLDAFKIWTIGRMGTVFLVHDVLDLLEFIEIWCTKSSSVFFFFSAVFSWNCVLTKSYLIKKKKSNLY